MYAVIFEVQPKPGRRQDYLDLAAALKLELEIIEGFISIERFASLTSENKMLSVSFWRDAAAVKRWRQHDRHRRAQLKGRSEIFADYRLSVGKIVRQYGMFDRAHAPKDAVQPRS
jgi:heme-degrading monooxygenase HmoA